MPQPAQPECLKQTGDGLELRIKVVPGSKRSAIVGILGDRLKIAVSAPPEGGKANKAVCKLIAQALRITERDIALTHGQSQPRKTVLISGVDTQAAIEALGLTTS